MISVGEACVLGVVQGATEFLPVSSSGHLAVVHSLLTPLPGAQTAAFDVALHGGTLVAVVAYFRRDLAEMSRGLLGVAGGWRRTWTWMILLATLPAMLVVIPFQGAIEQSFHSLRIVGLNFLLTGTLLWAAARVRGGGRDEDGVRPVDAVVIGCFQACALLPGISRSGATLAGGVLCGLDEEVAARFGFLLGIPAIVAAEVSQLGTLRTLSADSLGALAAGTVVAGLVGFAAIWGFMQLVRVHRLHYFAYYLWPLGIFVLAASVVKGS